MNTVAKLPNLKKLEQGILSTGEYLLAGIVNEWMYGSDPFSSIQKEIFPKYFIRSWERALWEALCELKHKELAPDITTILEAFRASQDPSTKKVEIDNWMIHILTSAGTTVVSNLNHYAENLAKEYLAYRKAKIEAESFAIRDHDERVKRREELYAELESEIKFTRRPYEDGTSMALALIEDWEAKINGEHHKRHVGLGFETLKEVPFALGQVCYLAGRAGMGKTTVLINILRQLLEQERTVAVFSLEMENREIAQRLCAQFVGISHMIFHDPAEASIDEVDKAYEAMSLLHKKPILLQESPGLSLERLEDTIKIMKKDKPDLSVIVVDHIHIMYEAITTVPMRVGITQITGKLKELARKYELAIIAAAQMNRDADKRDDRAPRLSDLRESGSIEQDADAILMVYRDNYYTDEEEEKVVPINGGFKNFGKDRAEQKPAATIDPSTKIYVRKNRHGQRNNFVMRFEVDRQCFRMTPL